MEELVKAVCIDSQINLLPKAHKLAIYTGSDEGASSLQHLYSLVKFGLHGCMP